MSTRTYTNIDVIVVNETVNGVVSGSKFNRSCTSGRFATGPADINGVSVFGRLDFTSFPAIPANALISHIACTADGSAGANTTATTGDSNGETVITIMAITLPSTIDDADSNDLIASSPPDDDEVLLRQLIFEVDFPIPITRDELVTRYGFGGGTFPTDGSLLGIVVSCQSTVNTDIATAVGNSAITNWTFTVTYSGGVSSWFIKPTEKVINGGKINIIEDDDIILVPEGDEQDAIDAGFVFYGAEADFPAGPDFFWWAGNDFFQFFIFSPISPGLGWSNVGVSPPTCAACTSIALGELTILIANASGIYTLTQGKTNDTLYLRATSDTFDFKIPNPFAKTGLVP